MEDDVDAEGKVFYNAVREYIIWLLIIILLCVTSYAIICAYRRKTESEDYYTDDYDDAVVYKIAILICTLTLAVSFGAVLLLPMSIVANEAIIVFPNSYYLQWVNSSLILGLWNITFLTSNLCLFVLLPFAYLFTESEGFPGSKKSISSRVKETLLVLALLTIVVCGIAWVISALLDTDTYSRKALFDVWNFYLPYLYSCISLLGVVLLLICTPVGFARMFTVTGDTIVRPQFRRNLDEEYTTAALTENALRRRLDALSSSPSTSSNVSHITSSPTSQTQSSFKSNGSLRSDTLHQNGQQNLSSAQPLKSQFKSKLMPSQSPNDVTSLNTHTSHNDHKHSQLPTQTQIETSFKTNGTHAQTGTHTQSQTTTLTQTLTQRHKHSTLVNGKSRELEEENLKQQLADITLDRIEIEKRQQVSSLRRNLGYPLVIILLLALTAICVLMVTQNTIELLIGLKALPVHTKEMVLGISSLSKLGPIGAMVEILLILYLMLASVVGFYSLPKLKSLKPKRHDTPMTKIIINCATLLVLSSALPVLTRTLGITNFDLMGHFRSIEWLGNWTIILSYNLVFGVSTALCLTTKFTGTLRRELFSRLQSVFQRGPRTTSVSSSTNGDVTHMKDE